MLAMTTACRDSQAVDPTASQASISRLQAEAPQSGLETVAKGLALALDEPQIRRALKERMRLSRFREHKLPLQDSLLRSSAGIALLNRAAARLKISRAEMVNTVNALPPIELYMPVRAQRGRWNGENGVLVVAAMSEDASPVAFTAAGQRLLLSKVTAPETPAIVLTLQELRSSDTVSAPTSVQLSVASPALLPIGPPGCQEARAVPVNTDAMSVEAGPCDQPPPGSYPPAWPNLGALPNRPGVYMQAMKIYNNHEPWYRGDPELEFQVEVERANSVERNESSFPYVSTITINSPKPTPVGCSGRLASGLRSFEFNGEDGATYIQNVLLFEPDSVLRREEIHSFPDGQLIFTRLTPFQFPVKIILWERDDGAECPKPTKEGVEGGFSLQVGVKFTTDGEFKSWDAKPKAKDLLATFWITNPNDHAGTWTFDSWGQLVALNRQKMSSNSVDVYFSTSPVLRTRCAFPNPGQWSPRLPC